MIVNLVKDHKLRTKVIKHGTHTAHTPEVARTFHKDPKSVYFMNGEYYIIERSTDNGNKRN